MTWDGQGTAPQRVLKIRGTERYAGRHGVHPPISAKKLKLVRTFSTRATERYSLGGRIKDKVPPKPTLPRLKYLEDSHNEEGEAQGATDDVSAVG